MLFNSIEFIVLYLPITLIGFAILTAHSRAGMAVAWLVCLSYAFYLFAPSPGWSGMQLVTLLATSTTANFLVGRLILRLRAQANLRAVPWITAAAVLANLALLAYYKYAKFFVDAFAGDVGWTLEIAIAAGISFFTFTQIAFLVDAARGEVQSMRFGEYALFVSYFPHLIAGPIMHHRDMVPQFHDAARRAMQIENVAVGLSMFSIGLVKKTILADGFAPFANSTFQAASSGGGGGIGTLEAWTGVLAYTFQIYFDFSAYSDMACGLSMLFGIRLPINFNSPYKATSIIDFWNRWHISLSNFLRDYVYIRLGGNQRGPTRRNLNLMITMLLGGLWHGAGWTFILWGGAHGLLLIVNHAMRALVGPRRETAFSRIRNRVVVLIAVSALWVLFEAGTLGTAGNIYLSLIGWNGIGAVPKGAMYWLAAGLMIVWFTPNTYEIFANYRVILKNARSPIGSAGRFAWQPTLRNAAVFSVLFVAGIMAVTKVSPFLYFNF